MSSVFRFEELEGHVGVVTFDIPDKKVNTLSSANLRELAGLVAELERRSDLQGLLFCSGKPGQFIAGADLNELASLVEASPEQVRTALAAGHELFTRLSRLPFPTVALIDGNCMGGGTELVLSLDERLASTNPSTKIALPETTIGLIPGWGGTQRMPRLVGIHYAIDMICSGEGVSGARAAELGLVFDAVPADRLLDEGKRLLADLQSTGEWRENRKRREQPLGLSEDQMNFAFAVAEGAVRGKTKGQYPAPLAALKAIREGVYRPLDEGLQVEREVAVEVVGTPISANLIGVFFMSNKLSRDPGVDDPTVKPRAVQRVGVLGSGLMGSGIATAHARRGIDCSMVDVDDARIADGMKRARDVVESRIKIGRAKPQDLLDLFSHLNGSTSRNAFAECDVVVEAITENEELKRTTYRELAPILRDDAILASNTSTISITRMAEAAPHPERFVGMHFFNPVDRMTLVEVVRGAKTSPETVATIVALARQIGKTPIVCGDCPGFLVNRILLPYMNEALVMLLEGASMDAIDKAAVKFGMPMGPIALHDLVGIDTAYYAGRVLLEAFSDRAVLAPILEQLVAAGRLGVKTGAGFRKHGGKKSKPAPDPAFEPLLERTRTDQRAFDEGEITDRLFLPMLLEATRILEEHIVREPAHVEMGLILGIGFPAFRGGILHWCDSEGAGKIVDRLTRYRPLGKRFEPTDMLEKMATSGTKFFPHNKT